MFNRKSLRFLYYLCMRHEANTASDRSWTIHTKIPATHISIVYEKTIKNDASE
jgi:hypothetical protein